MAKAVKAGHPKIQRTAGSGTFHVAKQAVKSDKFSSRELRDAVRKVVAQDAAKPRR